MAEMRIVRIHLPTARVDYGPFGQVDGQGIGSGAGPGS